MWILVVHLVRALDLQLIYRWVFMNFCNGGAAAESFMRIVSNGRAQRMQTIEEARPWRAAILRV
jgi:hypothetical protein